MSKEGKDFPWLPPGGTGKTPPLRDSSADSSKSLGAIPKGGIIPGSGSGDVKPTKPKVIIPQFGKGNVGELEVKTRMDFLVKSRGYVLRSINKRTSTCKKLLDDLQTGTIHPNEVTRQIATNAFSNLKEKYQELDGIQHEIVLLSTESDLEAEAGYMDKIDDNMDDIYNGFSRYCFMEAATENQSTLQNSSMDAGEALLQSLNINYDHKKNVNVFTGKDIIQYKHFISQWRIVETQLLAFGRTRYQLLTALKDVLEGEPLSYVKNLPVAEESYDLAMDALEQRYDNGHMAYASVMDEMFNIPSMPTDNAKAGGFLTSIVRNNQSISALRLVEEWGLLTQLHVIGSKLNQHTRREWEGLLWKKKSKTDPKGHTATMNDLIDLVRKQVQTSEGRQFDIHHRNAPLQTRGNSGGFGQAQASTPTQKPKTLPQNFNIMKGSGSAKGAVSKRKEPKCHLCNTTGDHWGTRCPMTRDRSPQEVLKMVDRHRLCRMCFSKEHDTNNCPKGWHCTKCNSKKHHPLVHVEERNNPTCNSLHQVVNQMITDSGSLLQVVKGKIGDTVVNILLDSGANLNLLSRTVADKLRLKGKRVPLRVTTVGNRVISDKDGTEVSCNLTSLDKSWSIPLTACTMEDISKSEQLLTFSKEDYPHLSGLDITMDLPRMVPLEIDLLIGEPMYSQIVTGPIIRGKNADEPVAWGSNLGYFLGGKYSWSYEA